MTRTVNKILKHNKSTKDIYDGRTSVWNLRQFFLYTYFIQASVSKTFQTLICSSYIQIPTNQLLPFLIRKYSQQLCLILDTPLFIFKKGSKLSHVSTLLTQILGTLLTSRELYNTRRKIHFCSVDGDLLKFIYDLQSLISIHLEGNQKIETTGH